MFDVVGQALLPTLCLAGTTLIVAAAMQDRKRLVAPGLAVLAALPLLGGDQTGGPAGIDVYQHNVWVRNPDPARIRTAVGYYDPDIAVLLEARLANIDEDLSSLSASYPYQVKEARDETRFGLRLLSKHRILKSELSRTAVGMSWLYATLDGPDGAFDVAVAHLTRPWPFDDPDRQIAQLDELQGIISRRRGDRPLLLVGDFNSAPWARLAARLNARLGLTAARSGLAGTWPGRIPSPRSAETLAIPTVLSIPIDLQFSSEGARISNRRVRAAYGSDHRAVTFTFHMTDEATQ